MNGKSHTGNIASTNRSTERRGQTLKVRGISFGICLIIAAANDLPCMPEVADLRESEIEREEQSSAQKQIYEPGRSADVAVYGGEPGIEGLKVHE